MLIALLTGCLLVSLIKSNVSHNIIMHAIFHKCRYSINAVKPGMPKFINIFRLRLVRVKVFSENRYFPEMLFSGKENVFMCLVAFQKMFRKIFSDVWLCS